MITTAPYGKYDIEPFNQPVRAIGESGREAGPAVLTQDAQESIRERFREESVRELGQRGTAALVSKPEVGGYPQHYDEVVPTEASADAPKALQPGDYGYSDDERFRTAPAVLTSEQKD